MNFKSSDAAKIVDGRIVQIWKPVTGPLTDEFGICRIKVGRPVEVRDEAYDLLGVIDIVAVRRARIGDIRPEEARASGFINTRGQGSTSLFFEGWRDTYGVLHREQEAWVITFEFERDRSLFLARTIGGPGGDYTPNRRLSNDEAEVVDPSAQLKFSQNAAAIREIVHGATNLQKRAKSLGRRVREEILAAGRAGLNVDAEVTVIAEQLELIEQRRDEAKQQAA